MTVSMVKKSPATIPVACGRRHVVHDSDERSGAGSIPACVRVAHTVDAATVMASRASFPWMRRSPHAGFSEARRVMVWRVSSVGDGRAWPVRGGPVVRDEASMPGQDRVGLDQED